MRREENAYLTIYLTLCMTLVLSLCLTLIEGARRNGARLEAEIAMENGLQSILAEYHRELFYQYNIFAIDSSYGSELAAKANTERHLKQYLDKNLDLNDVFSGSFLYRDFFGLSSGDVKLTKVSYLTDEGGSVFRHCAADAVKDDLGLNLLSELQEWMRKIEVNGLEERKVEEEKSALDSEIQEYDGMEIDTGDEEPYILRVINPTDRIEAQRNKGILKLVLKDDAALSANAIRPEGLIMDRLRNGQINSGNIPVQQLSEEEQLLERFFFQEYLLRYMGHYGQENDEDALHYQIEYLVTEGNEDAENLRTVLKRICAIREAANTLYLFSDGEKRGEAELVSTLVCNLALVPELAPVLEAAILIGWAYAESIYDIRTLLSGGRVPLIKSAESWHYGLDSALSGELGEEETGGSGLSYEDYLRIFMMCTDLHTLTARAMNMVEADIRLTAGNKAFRLDGCFVDLESAVQVNSSYGYDFEIVRKKTYVP